MTLWQHFFLPPSFMPLSSILKWETHPKLSANWTWTSIKLGGQARPTSSTETASVLFASHSCGLLLFLPPEQQLPKNVCSYTLSHTCCLDRPFDLTELSLHRSLVLSSELSLLSRHLGFGCCHLASQEPSCPSVHIKQIQQLEPGEATEETNQWHV